MWNVWNIATGKLVETVRPPEGEVIYSMGEIAPGILVAVTGPRESAPGKLSEWEVWDVLRHRRLGRYSPDKLLGGHAGRRPSRQSWVFGQAQQSWVFGHGLLWFAGQSIALFEWRGGGLQKVLVRHDVFSNSYEAIGPCFHSF